MSWKFDIFVRDTASDGIVHRIGDDIHDELYVDKTGTVQYRNLQNGEGTSGDYQFCPSEDGELLLVKDRKRLWVKPEPLEPHPVQEWDGKHCPCCGESAVRGMGFAFCGKCDWYVGNAPSDKARKAIMEMFEDD